MARKLGLRSHRKVLHTGKHYAERDKQFRHIASQREAFRESGDPRISVYTKKKELVGQFNNTGQTWCREGEKVNDHDFRSDAEALLVPYGIYDPERNAGHVCVSTSKWNPIEHRLFSQISATWSGFVLRTVAIVLGLIRRTTTRTGLTVTATQFEKTYKTGVKVSQAEFNAIQLTRHEVCPQWNYTIRPHPKNME